MVPGILSGNEPSPQFTLIDEIVPSGSVALKFALTVAPVLAGLGVTPEIATLGDRSFTVSVVLPDPFPALLVAVTVIVKV